MYIYVYVCVCVSLQGVPLGFVSCHRNPLLGIHSRFRPLFRSPSVSAKATITGQAIFLKRAPEKNGVETKKALTSLSEKSCAFHSMSISPHYISAIKIRHTHPCDAQPTGLYREFLAEPSSMPGALNLIFVLCGYGHASAEQRIRCRCWSYGRDRRNGRRRYRVAISVECQGKGPLHCTS